MPVFIDKLYGVSFADDAAGVGDDGGIARVFIEEIPDFLADPSVAIGIAFIQRPSTSALFGAMEEIAGERCADAAIVLRRERPIMPCGSGDVAAHLTSHATEPVTAYGRCGIVARTLLAARSELATAIAIFIACAARISARCELKAAAADVDIARLAATALTEVSILEAEAMRPAIKRAGLAGLACGFGLAALGQTGDAAIRKAAPPKALGAALFEAAGAFRLVLFTTFKLATLARGT